MTLKSLKRHKIFVIAMTIVAVAIGIYAIANSNVNATYSAGLTCTSCDQGQLMVTSEGDVAATCGKDGKDYFVCNKCGATFFNDIPATGNHDWHNWSYYNQQECMRRCKICGQQEVKSHVFDENKPQCKYGLICTVCGGEVMAATNNHVYVYDGTTSDESGHNVHCQWCGTTGTKQSHTYENGTCSVCSYECTHNITTAATCGTDSSPCTICGYIVRASEIDHNLSEYQTSAEGHWRYCTECDYEEEIENHIPGAATCTEPTKCVKCGEIIEAASGHHSFKWEEITETNHKGACEVCGETMEAEHEFVWRNESDTDNSVCYHYEQCICDYIKEGSREQCKEPKDGKYSSVFKDKHGFACAECGMNVVEPHNFVNGICVCGATESTEQCKHEAVDWTGTSSTKHSGTCLSCGEAVEGTHEFSDATCIKKATCKDCGYETGELADHTWNSATGECTVEGCGATCEHDFARWLEDLPLGTPIPCNSCGFLCPHESGFERWFRISDDLDENGAYLWTCCSWCSDCDNYFVTEGIVQSGFIDESGIHIRRLDCPECGLMGARECCSPKNLSCTQDAICMEFGDRIVGSALGHKWDSTTGTCIREIDGEICGAVCEHTYENGTCTVCGFKKITEECEHDYKYDATKQPDDSTHMEKCDKCGASKVMPHTFDQCTGRCSICNHYVSNAELGHDYEYTDNEDGESHKVTCLREDCDYLENEQHTWSDTDSYCTLCRASCKHEGIEYKTTVEPTCTTEGKKEGTCPECRTKRTLPIAALGHTDPGKYTNLDETNHVKYCTVCGEKIPNTEKPHNMVDGACTECGQTEGHVHTPGADATCTTPQTCTDCGAQLKEKLGHIYKYTDSEDGESHKVTCLRENCDYSEKKQHTWSDTGDDCTLCGASCKHEGIEYKTTVEPTCTTEGKKEGTCPECRTKQTLPIAALGHTDPGKYTNLDETNHVKYCTVCGEKIPNTEKPHNMVDGACTECGQTEGHVHTPGADATCTTEQTCTTCGAKLKEKLGHDWNAQTGTCKREGCGVKCAHNITPDTVWKQEKAATCKEKGVEITICPDCGYTLSREIPVKEHTWATGWSSVSESQHAKICTACGDNTTIRENHKMSKATCEAPATCEDCGYTSGSKLEHTPGAEATCTEAQICTVCKKEIEPKKGHDKKYTDNKDGESHAVTCLREGCNYSENEPHTKVVTGTGDENNHTLECEHCKAKLNEPHNWEDNTCTACGRTKTATPEHTHSYTIVKHDDEKHWLECSCGNKKADSEEAHTLGEWTDNGNGKLSATCTYAGCGYVKTKDKPSGEDPHTHSYTIVKHDDEKHWLECSCGNKKADSEATHTYEKWTNNGDGTHSATCTYTGCTYKSTEDHEMENGTCKKCKFIINDNDKEEQPKCAHENTEVQKDDTHHWRVCIACDAKIENTEAAHTYKTWTDNGDGTHKATCTYAGCGNTSTKKHTFEEGKCTVCSAEEQKAECEHTYTKVEHDNEKHWITCSKCGLEKENTQATHTYKTWTDNGDGTHSAICTYTGCGNTATKKHTFTNGECTYCKAEEPKAECEHEYTKTQNDDTHHWLVCAKCNEKKANSEATHTLGTWKDNKNGSHSATCTYAGCTYKATKQHSYTNGECSSCGAEEPKNEECEHTYTKVQNDDIHHWLVCTKCNEKKTNSEATHTLGAWKDNGDGTHSATCTYTGCTYKATKQHSYSNGECTDCNADEPKQECEHVYNKVLNDDEKHWVVCSKCGLEKANSEGKHTLGTWKDNGNGTHSAECTYAGCAHKETKKHTFENEECKYCNAKEQKENCDHEYTKVQKDDEKHWIVCSKCGLEKEGSEEKHTYDKWVDNGDGTHSATCTDEECKYVSTQKHNFEDSVCEDCKAKEEKDNSNNDNNNNNQNNNNNNKPNNDGKDDTTADKVIPNAGKFAIAGAVIAIISLGGVGLVKSIKYKDI